MLRSAATWIKRLDRADTARTSVHVYRVKYGDARQMARVLTDMFLGGGSSNLLDSPDNQVAPGSGASTSSSADRLSLNANSPAANGGFAGRATPGAGAPGGFGTQNALGTQSAATNGANTNAIDSSRTSASGNG
jgi:general secretion pathway protein D